MIKKLAILFIGFFMVGCIFAKGVDLYGFPNKSYVYHHIHSSFYNGISHIEDCSTTVYEYKRYVEVWIYFKWGNSKTEFYVFRYNDVSKKDMIKIGEWWTEMYESYNDGSSYCGLCKAFWKISEDGDYKYNDYHIKYVCTFPFENEQVK